LTPKDFENLQKIEKAENEFAELTLNFENQQPVEDQKIELKRIIVFQEMSTKILLKLDSVETNNDEIRTKRRTLAKKISTYLSNIDNIHKNISSL